jgi:hypothetical protein
MKPPVNLIQNPPLKSFSILSLHIAGKHDTCSMPLPLLLLLLLLLLLRPPPLLRHYLRLEIHEAEPWLRR